jgi:hypothetical protein
VSAAARCTLAAVGDTTWIRVAVTAVAIVAVGVLVGVLAGSPLAGVLVAVIGLAGLAQRLRA